MNKGATARLFCVSTRFVRHSLVACFGLEAVVQWSGSCWQCLSDYSYCAQAVHFKEAAAPVSVLTHAQSNAVYTCLSTVCGSQRLLLNVSP